MNFLFNQLFFRGSKGGPSMRLADLKIFLTKILLVGESYHQSKDQGQWVIQTPKDNLHLIITTDGQATFKNTQIPGVYRVYELSEKHTQKTITKLPLGSQPVGTFTINVDTKESSPQKISEENIKTFLPNLKVTIKSPELSGSKLQSAGGMLLTTPSISLCCGNSSSGGLDDQEGIELKTNNGYFSYKSSINCNEVFILL